MNCNELVSVVIPTYNRENTIIECLQSVLNQTYTNIEVIVVDDGSVDHTDRLFGECRDPRVKYYKYSPNRGACYARNYGIQRANGKYIAFQDSDDIWDKYKIEKQLEFIVSKKADFVFCGMKRINPMEESFRYYPDYPFDETKDSISQLLMHNLASTQTILVDRKVFDEVQFDVSFRRYQDWDFCLQVAAHGYSIAYQNEALVESTVQVNSISATVKSCEAYEHLYDKYRDVYRKNPVAEGEMYRKMANSCRKSDREKAKKYFSRALSLDFRFRDAIKYCLILFGLWK